MATRSEVVAILSSGVSYRRFLYPYMISATTIALLSLILNNFVIPHATKKRIEFENLYINNKYFNDNKNIHIQLSPNNYIYLERYDVDQNAGYRFSIEKFKDRELIYKLVAESIRWDSVKQNWKINNYYIRNINGTKESIKTGLQMDSVLGFTPSEFGRKNNMVETMDYFKLNDYIKEERIKGANNIEVLEIEKYKRNSVPFATFIFTVIGASIASRKVRGGIGMHIATGFIISFLFVLFMQVSTTFAVGGFVSPLVAVWIPNILFGIIALFLLKTAQK
jgi:lipopolysaccharide export system permease protein